MLSEFRLLIHRSNLWCSHLGLSLISFHFSFRVFRKREKKMFWIFSFGARKFYSFNAKADHVPNITVIRLVLLYHSLGRVWVSGVCWYKNGEAIICCDLWGVLVLETREFLEWKYQSDDRRRYFQQTTVTCWIYFYNINKCDTEVHDQKKSAFNFHLDFHSKSPWRLMKNS